MKIQLLSDLHFETQPEVRPTPARGADLLVLAGDIGSYQAGSRLQGTDFGLERFSPRGGWPTPVLYVPGNHEYDGLEFESAHAQLRATCERLGITWLERETCVMGGVRFVGTTLWADFDALAPASGGELRTLAARRKALRAADFYLRRNTALHQGQPLMADGWRTLGLACQDWLRQALSQPFEGPTVVVTHFAPSLRSADPRYGLTPGTAGFCNALDALLPLANVWMHGHLHCRHDYRAGGCRVVANPLGYAAKGEQEGFHEHFVVELERPAGTAATASAARMGARPC